MMKSLMQICLRKEDWIVNLFKPCNELEDTNKYSLILILSQD